MTDEPRLDIDCVPLGPFETNCYVVRPAGASVCWLFDPPAGAESLIASLRGRGDTVERIVITHGHVDHIAGVGAVKDAFGEAIVTAPAGDAHMLADPMANLSGLLGAPVVLPPVDQTVSAGDTLTLGALTWDVLDTAGHTPGGVSFYCRDAGVVIVGDSLFASSVGRTDFPGGDAKRLIDTIRANLLTLPDDTRVLCGHGGETTIGAERRSNPYLIGR